MFFWKIFFIKYSAIGLFDALKCITEEWKLYDCTYMEYLG